MAMKLCKDCGTEVSKSAKICPKCGKNQKNFFAQHKVLTFVLIVILFGAIAVSTGNNGSTTQQTGINITKSDTKITLEKFNQIKTGLTYQEVVDIIGEEGTVLSESNIGNNEKYHTIIYSWKAKNGIANANVTFQGGKVVSKAQIGLD